jgi:hypothetical protein
VGAKQNGGIKDVCSYNPADPTDRQDDRS